MSLQALFAPRSVAIAGASLTPGRPGYLSVENLLRFGFRGPIYPINPRGGRLLDLRVYRRLEEVPPVDLVVSLIPAEETPGLVERCRGRARALVICSGGFSDAGRRELEQEVVRRARAAGLRVLGPNVPGFINAPQGVVLSIGPLSRLLPGGISLVTQSGQFCTNVLEWAFTGPELGIGKAIDLGNKADVDELEVLDWLADDPHTSVVALHLEGLRDGRGLMERARRLRERGKRLVILKPGRTPEGRRSALSHTGSLAGSDQVLSGALRQCRLARARDMQEFFDAAKALALLPPWRGPRVAIVSITGGGATLAADALAECGLRLAELSEDTRRRIARLAPDWMTVDNPVDLGAVAALSGAARSFAESLDALLRDPQVDAVLLISAASPHPTPFVPDYVRLAEMLRGSPKPVVANVLGTASGVAEARRLLEGAGVPVYPTPERALRALGTLRDGTGR